jgi:hypothetical protein
VRSVPQQPELQPQPEPQQAKLQAELQAVAQGTPGGQLTQPTMARVQYLLERHKATEMASQVRQELLRREEDRAGSRVHSPERRRALVHRATPVHVTTSAADLVSHSEAEATLAVAQATAAVQLHVELAASFAALSDGASSEDSSAELLQMLQQKFDELQQVNAGVTSPAHGGAAESTSGSGSSRPPSRNRSRSSRPIRSRSQRRTSPRGNPPDTSSPAATDGGHLSPARALWLPASLMETSPPAMTPPRYGSGRAVAHRARSPPAVSSTRSESPSRRQGHTWSGDSPRRNPRRSPKRSVTPNCSSHSSSRVNGRTSPGPLATDLHTPSAIIGNGSPLVHGDMFSRAGDLAWVRMCACPAQPACVPACESVRLTRGSVSVAGVQPSQHGYRQWQSTQPSQPFARAWQQQC